MPLARRRDASGFDFRIQSFELTELKLCFDPFKAGCGWEEIRAQSNARTYTAA